MVKTNDSASLIDLGDGILCCEFHCKMNAIDPDITAMLNAGVDLLEEDKFDGMIIANQGKHFCAGANIFLILGEIMQQNWDGIEKAVRGLQGTGMRMKYCRKPIVAAPHHYTFGGGVEICQHADKLVLAGETYAGLVEMGVTSSPAAAAKCTSRIQSALCDWTVPYTNAKAIGQAVGTSGQAIDLAASAQATSYTEP